MIEVRGSKSEDRWSQTEHEIFQPLPVKMLTVSPSGFGKTSVILAAVDALFEHMDYWAIFSKSHMLDKRCHTCTPQASGVGLLAFRIGASSSTPPQG